MATYSIKDLETLSGIKAHTIRIWEQRYNLIEPRRTPTNIRFYTDEDLKYVLNIAFLNKNGLRISQIAKMERGEIATKVDNISQDSFEDTNQLQALTMAMMELNLLHFESLLQASIQQYGFEGCILRLIMPFLEKLNLLWLTGSVSNVHEQFVHNIIRRKVLAAVDNLQIKPSKTPQRTCMLYLMEGEDLEILTLMVEYFLKARGIMPIYLGMRIGLEDLNIAYAAHQPDFIFTSIAEHRAKFSITNYVQTLSDTFSNSMILLTGYQAINMQPAEGLDNVLVLEDFYEIVDFLDNLQEKRKK